MEGKDMAILNKKTHKKHPVLDKKRALIKSIVKTTFWFTLGAFLGFFFFTSFLYIYYKNAYQNLIYTGIFVNDVHFGGKTRAEVQNYFAQKNALIQQSQFIMTGPDTIATISAKQIHLGYDEKLIATQAYTIGRSSNMLSNIRFILEAYFNGVELHAADHYDEKALDNLLTPIEQSLNKEPVNAIFTMDQGKVTDFKLSKNGQQVDEAKLTQELSQELDTVSKLDRPQVIHILIPIETVKPKIATDQNMGIIESIGVGTSHFAGSIDNRVYNINLAASRINGTLVAPGETFSFDKTIGDISTLSGYKQAYVIQDGKTVLGDGGGVCQVSTTLFRAVLNAGLPVVERNQHAYRVGYYEQDSPPGIDAAIYTPDVDFKFKNDTGASILIEAYPDPDNYALTFELFGTKDGRQVAMTEPVVTSQTPAPPAKYEDDPTLPKGEVKQVDFAAGGADVSFSRTVTKNGKTILSDTFVSDYKPWQAVYLRGTQ